jgi:hypothetical protein
MLVSAFYSIGLAISMFANQQSQIAEILGLADKSRQAAAWSLCVLAIMLLLTYLLGRVSLRWHNASILSCAVIGREK